MRILVLILMGGLFSLTSCSQTKFWDDLNQSQKTAIIEQCQSKLIMKYCNGDIILSSTIEAQELLNDLVSADVVTLPLNLHVLNKFCLEADGAFSEILGKYCLAFTVNNGQYLMTFFKEKDNEDLKNLYALLIGTELYFKNDGLSDGKYGYKEFKEALTFHKNSDIGLDKTITTFLEMVDKAIKNMD